MTQYAQFDPAAESPAPVTGWYDTCILRYPNLPDVSCLVEVSASQWAMHFSNPSGWVVDSGRLMEKEVE